MSHSGTSSFGVYMLNAEHADAIQQLASDPAIAATTRVPHPYPDGAAKQFVEQMQRERLEGTSYVFAVQDGRELVGLIGLHGVDPTCARELGYWIGKPYWGKGYASFAVNNVLHFAFHNLRLDDVHSSVFESNAASRRVLEKNGAELQGFVHHNDPLLKHPDALLAQYHFDRVRWTDALHAPQVARLHPLLRDLLLAELNAGNEIAESSQGWPEAGSVLIRLAKAFKTTPTLLPATITYSSATDPHAFAQDYSTTSPIHILAC